MAFVAMKLKGTCSLGKSRDKPAAAESPHSCPTLCGPTDGSPPGPRPWDSPGKNTAVGCHCLLQCMTVKSESEVAQSCPTLHEHMDCSLPGSSAWDFPRQCLKSRDITLLTKVHRVKAMVLPVVMYGCENWTIKKAEHQIIDAFETAVLEKTLRSPWTIRRSDQSILKEINPEYSLERLMLKLKHQYFGHLIRKAYSLEKTLMLGKTEGRRRRG